MPRPTPTRKSRSPSAQKRTSGWKSRITYFDPSRQKKPLKSSQEIVGTTFQRRIPLRSPTP